ncbi:MAG: PilT/PilU family type 4a pilus ATPase, partial [Clostridia bacterium]|nr:PilT/PilU family type 4a pilus ATPase [Clostridia bacterium]
MSSIVSLNSNSLDIYSLIEETSRRNASDLHISVGLPPTCRVNGHLVGLDHHCLSPNDTESIVDSILNDQQKRLLKKRGELDISFTSFGSYRCRLNIFKQKGFYSLAFRMLNPKIKGFEELGLPSVLSDLCCLNRGLILITGPTGTGKTTTLAAMVDWINSNRDCHIVTLEDPIEYIHQHKRSIVNQREIGQDSNSYANALRAVLRQDPDVILIGEMRDLESISIALTAAETGHLVLSTLHTIGASKTIDRIIDVFPPYQQNQIRTQLSMVLQGVISQQLIPLASGTGRVVATEVMMTTPAIRNMIRENKVHQISNVIQTSGKQSMKAMDTSLLELLKQDKITVE